MDPITEALRNISNGSLENDRALLKLCEALIERVLQLEQRMIGVCNVTDTALDRVVSLEQRVTELEDDRE